MTTPGPDVAERTQTGDREAIERDIQQTRERLGETVDELTRRLDVKTRLRERVSAGSEKAKGQPAVTAAVALSVVAAVGLLVWWRRS